MSGDSDFVVQAADHIGEQVELLLGLAQEFGFAGFKTDATADGELQPFTNGFDTGMVALDAFLAGAFCNCSRLVFKGLGQAAGLALRNSDCSGVSRLASQTPAGIPQGVLERLDRFLDFYPVSARSSKASPP